MSERPAPPRPSLKRPGAMRRRAVSLSSNELVEMKPFFEDRDLPLLVQPKVSGVNLFDWAAGNRELVEEKLLQHGGILFRGFDVREADDLERFIQAVSGEALEYRERSSPRHAVAGNIYTSTDYPPSYPIFLHNENSYQKVWPRKIFFFCHTPAAEGGATPLADCRRVAKLLPEGLRQRFVEKGWMYVRNFGDGFGLDWQTVFQTSDRTRVEEHCAASDIAVEWKQGGRLRTRAVRPAVTRHPKTGEMLWFNHATFFHITTLEPTVREALLAEFAEEDLPANTYYGDGTPIEPEVLDELRSAYHAETVSFPWQRGDLLMLDNMMVAHGRAPYAGERKVLVGMAEPVSRD